MNTNVRAAVSAAALLVAVSIPVLSQQQNQLGYDDTPMHPNGKWRVHDSKRPQPQVVTPGPAAAPAGVPSDAKVLLGPGADTGAWQMNNGAAVTWPMKDGVLEIGRASCRERV